MRLSTYLLFIAFLVLTSCKKEKTSSNSNPEKIEEVTVAKQEIVIDSNEEKIIEEKLEVKEKKVQKITLSESIIPIKKPTTPKEEKVVKEMIDDAIKQTQEKGDINLENEQVEIIIKEVVKVEKPKLTPKIIKVSTADFKSRIDGKDVQLIDVRTPKEYKESHIKNAKNINIYDDDFLQQTTSLTKSKPVYVYCRSGVRSMKAANKLKDAGFKVYNLNGGIKTWRKEGNKVEK